MSIGSHTSDNAIDRIVQSEIDSHEARTGRSLCNTVRTVRIFAEPSPAHRSFCSYVSASHHFALLMTLLQ